MESTRLISGIGDHLREIAVEADCGGQPVIWPLTITRYSLLQLTSCRYRSKGGSEAQGR